jgi:hypothetical protein
MTATAETETLDCEGPVWETGGTTNLTTTAHGSNHLYASNAAASAKLLAGPADAACRAEARSAKADMMSQTWYYTRLRQTS